ncbi:MAG: phage integrase N-terminal SAM-like domain-containing protein [Methylococcales bacterium]|nr:phage integrase N-terminal SAM-like domain-containing protein [Methylococcales bacterium]
MKLLSDVKNIMRPKHYSIHTENSYCDWIKRFILFHKMQIRNELFIRPEGKIEDILRLIIMLLPQLKNITL